MLDFDMPGILSGKTADTCTNFSVRRHALIRRTKEFDDWVATKGAKAASVHVWFKPAPFARMLAKVAHSYTVATLGLDGFTPFLPDAILRPDYPHLAYLVGGDPNTPSPDFGCLHRLSLETRFVDGKQMIVVRIRLFASSGDQEHGLPIYYVVAGEALQPAKDSDFKHPTSSISGCRTLSSARFA